MPQEPEIVHVDRAPTAVVREQVRMDALPGFYDQAYRAVAAALAEQQVEPRSAIGLYLSPPTETVDLEAGFVVDSAVEPDGEVVASSLPGGDVARLTHVGSYDELPQTWGRVMVWVGEQGRAPAGPMWEVYVTEPNPQTDPSTLRTDLFCLLE